MFHKSAYKKSCTVAIAALFVAMGGMLFADKANAVPLVPTIVFGAGGSFAAADGDANGGKVQDESDGYKVFGGLETSFGVPGIQPSLGIEAQYSDLGDFKFNGGAFNHEASTIGISAIGGLQLLEMFRANAKVGLHVWDSDIAGFKRDGTDLFYGLSGELTLAPFTAIRFEWEHFDFKDSNFGLDSDVDVGSVSFVLRVF